MSSFVKMDIDHLGQHVQVIQLNQNWRSKVKLPFTLIRQFFFLLANIRKIKVVVVSFAGYHAFLPTLFAKLKGIPSFIVLNGTDAVSIPSFNYGSHRKTIQRQFCKWSVQLATELWPVSQSLMDGNNHFSENKLVYGIQHSFPQVKTPSLVIPNGFEFDFWLKNVPTSVTRNGIITVVSSQGQFKLKGIDLLIETAGYFPEIPVSIVGMEKPTELEVPANVTFHGKVPHDRLRQLFYEHQFYTQLSVFEGFGCSLCEAMLCGCIPIGSNVNAIPEIMGESGVIIYKRTMNDLSDGLKVLQNVTSVDLANRSQSASMHIQANFPIEKRIQTMLERVKYYS